MGRECVEWEMDRRGEIGGGYINIIYNSILIYINK